MGKQYVWAGIVLIVAAGCRQSANPGVPLSPILPLGSSTRVPPPATGSYPATTGYYQGQASSGAANVGMLTADQSSGVPVPSLSSESPAAPRYATAITPAVTAAIAPAGYAAGPSTSGSLSSATSSGVNGYTSIVSSGAAPHIPASALQQTPTGDPALRPAFRGMEVVDLTGGEPLQPTAPPTLEAYSSRVATAGSSGWNPETPVQAGQSPSPVVSPVAAAGSSAEPGATSAPAASVAAPDPSTPPTKISSAELPWRRPMR